MQCVLELISLRMRYKFACLLHIKDAKEFKERLTNQKFLFLEFYNLKSDLGQPVIDKCYL